MPHPNGIVSGHTHNNWCFNFKESHPKSNEFSSKVISVPPLLNDSVLNPPQLYLVCQQSFIYSHNKMPESQVFQYLLGLKLFRQIPCHRRPPKTEVVILMGVWWMCIS